MKKFYKNFIFILFLGAIMVPKISFAGSQQKTLSGVITSITGEQITITNGTAATYGVVLVGAALERKNGATMQLSELLIGDKVQISGLLWNDNSMNVSLLRDLTLYAHSGTFAGKITSINPVALSFTMGSKTYGTQVVSTNNFTSFTKNKSAAAFKDLELGMSVSVKATWDRSRGNVVASQVAGTLRFINIYFTGTLWQINGSSLTVVGNGNVLYGVDTSKAQIENKSGKASQLSLYKIGDSLRVWGKHVSGSVQITGTEIRDSLLSN